MGLDETQPSQMTLDQAPVVAADGGGEAPAAEEPKVEG